MQITELSQKNVEELAKLFVEMWPDCTFEEELAYCKKLLSTNQKTAFLVLNEEEYIGFAYLALRNDFVEGAKKYPVAYLEGIYIKDAFRKTGIATKLVQQAESWARKMGCTQLASDVEVGNKGSLHFHNKLGFKEMNRVVCFAKDI